MYVLTLFKIKLETINCTLKNSFVYEYYERFHPENYKASKMIIILQNICDVVVDVAMLFSQKNKNHNFGYIFQTQKCRKNKKS